MRLKTLTFSVTKFICQLSRKLIKPIKIETMRSHIKRETIQRDYGDKP